ncbi:hypothetical protein [Bacillus velezensis]|uniref:hypothetical protein n=1 Tax=Bacillus velezensis TaxID=492670 RepID=UPI000B613B63|nr:hypothetical protein [Bacillus velezensis]ASB52620.1 hypothetical protein S100072_01284 [Bacillus velezensis]QMT25913.1 hypothetical protein H2N97_06170 [Bacillus velezensis]WJN55910.1 hypothetical protein QTN52_06210 [Bacillus velezensis]
MEQAINFLEINEVLLNWAANDPPIEDFTVENVLYAIGLSENHYRSVLKYLMTKDGYELIPKKMLLCPSNHKIQSFGLHEDIEDELFDCYCGENDFSPENFLLVFEFTDFFKSQCQKKKKYWNPLKVPMLV